jgi:hypothetical protein
MITREKGSHNIVFHCDGCSEVADTGTDDFDEALEMAKLEGFTMKKEDDEWQHWCAICSDK